MAFLVGLLTAAETGVAAGGGIAAASTGLEASAVSGGAEAAGGLEAVAQNEMVENEMMTPPEGMEEEPQLKENSLDQKNEKQSSFDMEGQLKKAMLQSQIQAAEERRKEVESQLGK